MSNEKSCFLSIFVHKGASISETEPPLWSVQILGPRSSFNSSSPRSTTLSFILFLSIKKIFNLLVAHREPTSNGGRDLRIVRGECFTPRIVRDHQIVRGTLLLESLDNLERLLTPCISGTAENYPLGWRSSFLSLGREQNSAGFGRTASD